MTKCSKKIKKNVFWDHFGQSICQFLDIPIIYHIPIIYQWEKTNAPFLRKMPDWQAHRKRWIYSTIRMTGVLLKKIKFKFIFKIVI